MSKSSSCSVFLCKEVLFKLFIRVSLKVLFKRDNRNLSKFPPINGNLFKDKFTLFLLFKLIFDITLFDFLTSSIISFEEFSSFLFLFLIRLRFRLSEYNFCLLLNELKFEEFFLMVLNTNDILKII